MPAAAHTELSVRNQSRAVHILSVAGAGLPQRHIIIVKHKARMGQAVQSGRELFVYGIGRKTLRREENQIIALEFPRIIIGIHRGQGVYVVCQPGLLIIVRQPAQRLEIQSKLLGIRLFLLRRRSLLRRLPFLREIAAGCVTVLQRLVVPCLRRSAGQIILQRTGILLRSGLPGSSLRQIHAAGRTALSQIRQPAHGPAQSVPLKHGKHSHGTGYGERIIELHIILIVLRLHAPSHSHDHKASCSPQRNDDHGSHHIQQSEIRQSPPEPSEHHQHQNHRQNECNDKGKRSQNTVQSLPPVIGQRIAAPAEHGLHQKGLLEYPQIHQLRTGPDHRKPERQLIDQLLQPSPERPYQQRLRSGPDRHQRHRIQKMESAPSKACQMVRYFQI